MHHYVTKFEFCNLQMLALIFHVVHRLDCSINKPKKMELADSVHNFNMNRMKECQAKQAFKPFLQFVRVQGYCDKIFGCVLFLF